VTKDRAYLQHMLDMIGRIELATASGRAAFFDSVIFQDAVLRNLHTLTETTQRLSADLKSAPGDRVGGIGGLSQRRRSRLSGVST
jgi:uncharacterized protein with HEPN domain